MYAIIQTGGKQYKVKSGDRIKIEKVEAPIGAKVKIPNLILAFDGNTVKSDPKLLKNATVSGTILNHGKSKKVTSFKKKRRKGFQKKRGHRQEYTELIINSIKLD